MKKILVLKGCAGLGNRIITVLSALVYAEKTNRDLYIDWSDGLYGETGKNMFTHYFTLKSSLYIDSMNYNDIFAEGNTVYPDSIRKIACEPVYAHYFQTSHRFFKKFKGSRIAFLGFNKWKSHWSLEENRNKIHRFGAYMSSVFSSSSIPLGEFLSRNRKEDVVIFCDYLPTFLKEKLPLLRLSEPTATEFITHKNKLNTVNRIGVHVRNTDMKPTRPVDELIAGLKKRYGNPSIFLATDDAGIVEIFEREFSDVVELEKFRPQESIDKGLHKWASKNNANNMAEQVFKESILDLYLLASCNHIYYQGNSSFSRVAIHLFNKQSESCNWLTEKF
ncbi:MAG: hypothetical protein ACHQF2_01305 [Flavobacteriales bacterium]